MPNLILRFPTFEDKNEWMSYYKEFIKSNPNSDPLMYSKYANYEDFLIGIGKKECLTHSTTITIPTSSFILAKNNKIIGHISIHHYIDLNILREYEGHIGYGIRPKYRKKGYGTILLNLGIEKCKDLHIKEVFLSCDKENIASSKIIEKNSGILLEEAYIQEENAIFKKYKIVL